MSASTLRAAVALDGNVDRRLVQAALPKDERIELVAVVDLHDGAAALDDSTADVVVVACDAAHDDAAVTPFIESVARARRSRPVVVLAGGSPNGFVRRAFDAGADDILSLDGQTTSSQVLFALEKAVTRVGSAQAGNGSLGAMITVIGPKGGAGKTLVSTNLAAALATVGEPVALVDLDLQFGDVGLAMGIPPQRTLYDLATSAGSLDRVKLEAYLGTHDSGVRTLLAPLRPEQAASVGEDFLRGVYSVLRGMSRHVVVDTSSQLTPQVLDAVALSTHVCVVGMLDSLALKTTRVTLEALERMGQQSDRITFVLNRADSRVGITPADVQTIVGRTPDVLLPSSRDIATAVNEGVPIAVGHPRSEAAKAFAQLAARHAEPAHAEARPEKAARRAADRRLFRRLRTA
jgi:pilus assembly protein CpaE